MFVRVSVCAYAGFVLGGEHPQHLHIQQGSNWTASCCKIVCAICCPDHLWFYSWYVPTYVHTYICLATSFRTVTRGWVYIRACIAARTTKFHVLQFVTSQELFLFLSLLSPAGKVPLERAFFPFLHLAWPRFTLLDRVGVSGRRGWTGKWLLPTSSRTSYQSHPHHSSGAGACAQQCLATVNSVAHLCNSIPLSYFYGFYYLLLLTTTYYYSLLFTTTHYYSLLLTTTHYYSLLLTTTYYYLLLLTW